MPQSYASDYPQGIQVDPEFKAFFEDFYKISDTPEAHEKYSQQFTSDATLVMASKTVKGTEGILALRKGMWEKVVSRSHNPIKIFPFGSGSDEVMLYGTVEYGLKGGGSDSKEWSARAKLVKDDGAVKLAFYQVYLFASSQNRSLPPDPLFGLLSTSPFSPPGPDDIMFALRNRVAAFILLWAITATLPSFAALTIPLPLLADGASIPGMTIAVINIFLILSIIAAAAIIRALPLAALAFFIIRAILKSFKVPDVPSSTGDSFVVRLVRYIREARAKDLRFQLAMMKVIHLADIEVLNQRMAAEVLARQKWQQRALQDEEVVKRLNSEIDKLVRVQAEFLEGVIDRSRYPPLIDRFPALRGTTQDVGTQISTNEPAPDAEDDREISTLFPQAGAETQERQRFANEEISTPVVQTSDPETTPEPIIINQAVSISAEERHRQRFAAQAVQTSVQQAAPAAEESEIGDSGGESVVADPEESALAEELIIELTPPQPSTPDEPFLAQAESVSDDDSSDGDHPDRSTERIAAEILLPEAAEGCGEQSSAEVDQPTQNDDVEQVTAHIAFPIEVAQLPVEEEFDAPPQSHVAQFQHWEDSSPAEFERQEDSPQPLPAAQRELGFAEMVEAPPAQNDVEMAEAPTRTPSPAEAGSHVCSCCRGRFGWHFTKDCPDLTLTEHSFNLAGPYDNTTDPTPNMVDTAPLATDTSLVAEFMGPEICLVCESGPVHTTAECPMFFVGGQTSPMDIQAEEQDVPMGTWYGADESEIPGDNDEYLRQQSAPQFGYSGEMVGSGIAPLAAEGSSMNPVFSEHGIVDTPMLDSEAQADGAAGEGDDEMCYAIDYEPAPDDDEESSRNDVEMADEEHLHEDINSDPPVATVEQEAEAETGEEAAAAAEGSPRAPELAEPEQEAPQDHPPVPNTGDEWVNYYLRAMREGFQDRLWVWYDQREVHDLIRKMNEGPDRAELTEFWNYMQLLEVEARAQADRAGVIFPDKPFKL
ncbi:hypothetical protein FH972_022777 [Carpinus fangiana]|uniref:NTF2 domain-containing protein n=1 Tax=Carpinus fangiana TaxID=176857 RepID=A0A5N6KT93_9ROSI|nr:hypothetical protein FH972_022777 [Carpinus fangiana]